MKKYITLLGIFIVNFITLWGQPETMRGIVVSAVTDPLTGTYSAIGQPFFQQVSSDDYEFSYGVAQAQLETVVVNAETCENEPYTENGFDIPTSAITSGTSNFELYADHADPHGYDRLTKLVLVVWPTYHISGTTEMYYGTLPVIDGSEMNDGEDYYVVEGDNTIYFRSIHGCDSVVTLHASLCPYTVKDADSNLYNTLLLDNFCWTQSNLRTTHYFGDAHEAVPFAYVYYSPNYQNSTDIEETFGRLYTWYSAVHVPEGSDATPPLDSEGFVRGICPAGWHLPAVPETEALLSHTADELMSSNFWITGGGLNTTDFTLLPAGKYKASSGRFEGLFTDAYFWKVTDTSFSEPVAFCTAYYCDVLLPVPTAYPYDGFSVRCVKNY